MKNALKFLVLSLATLSFVSCCKTAACNNVETLTEGVVSTGDCPKCTQRYKAKAACCGTISESVLERATTQGWDGNPFIGLVPTMKPLVSE